MKLNKYEQIVYNGIVDILVPTMSPGKYTANQFFGTNPTNPRIVRHLYEQVKAGNVKHLSLVGTHSSEGYLIS